MCLRISVLFYQLPAMKIICLLMLLTEVVCCIQMPMLMTNFVIQIHIVELYQISPVGAVGCASTLPTT